MELFVESLFSRRELKKDRTADQTGKAHSQLISSISTVEAFAEEFPLDFCFLEFGEEPCSIKESKVDLKGYSTLKSCCKKYYLKCFNK